MIATKRRTQKERSLDMFREGKTLDEVIEVTSLSTAKRGLEEYLPEAREEVKRLNQKFRDLRARIKESQNKQEKMEQDIVDATHEISDKQKQRSSLKGTLEKLAHEVTSLKQELESIEKSLQDLDQQGLTQEHLTRLNEMDVTSWQDLLDRVSTSQKYKELVEQNQSIVDEVEGHISEKMKLEEDLTRLGEDVKSGEMRELLLRVRQLSIRGEPVASVKRFLTRMGSVKEYEELENQIARKSEELEAIKRNLSETRGTIRALRNDALKPIQATQEEAIKSINSVAEEASQEIVSRSEVVGDLLKEIWHEAVKAITIQEVSGRKAIGERQDQLAKALKEAYDRTFKVLDRLDEDIVRWGQIREEIGKYTSDIQRADLILGITKNPRAITTIPPLMASQLLEGIVNYVTAKYPNVKVKAPDKVEKVEPGPVVLYELRLTSLAEWLSHGVMRMHLEGVSA
jgi:chromosome segregation ATPase